MRQEQLEKDLEHLKLMLHYSNTVFERLEFAKRSGLSVNDEMVVDSLAMNLGQVGEQLDPQKLSQEIREKYDDIPWRDIKKFRNLAYHRYDKLQFPLVMKIINEYLPDLQESLEIIIKDIERQFSEH